MRKVAVDRDNVVLEARRIEAEKAAALAAPVAPAADDVFATPVATPEGDDA
jgi:DNA-directed RNA polymerase subunit beta'